MAADQNERAYRSRSSIAAGSIEYRRRVPSALIDDEPGLLELLEVLRHGRPPDRQPPRDLHDWLRPLAQALQDRAAGPVAQRVQDTIRLYFRGRRCVLTNRAHRLTVSHQ